MESANHLNGNLPEEVYPGDIEELRKELLETRQWLASRLRFQEKQEEIRMDTTQSH